MRSLPNISPQINLVPSASRSHFAPQRARGPRLTVLSHHRRLKNDSANTLSLTHVATLQYIPLRGSLPHLSFWNGSLNTTVQACLRRPTDTPKGVRPVHQSPIPSLGPVVEHVFVQSAQGSPFCFRLTILSRYCWTAVWKPQRRIQVSSWDPNKRKQPKNKTKKTINQTNKKPGNRPKTVRDV